jgi:ribonucrease Y
MDVVQILLVIAGLLAGGGLGYFVLVSKDEINPETIKKEMHEIIERSKKESHEIQADSKSHIKEIQEMAKQENERMEIHLDRLKESLKAKERSVQSQEDKNKTLEKTIKDEKQIIKQDRDGMDTARTEIVETLLKTVGTTREESIQAAKARIEDSFATRKDRFLKNRKEEAEEDCVKVAQNMLASAIQRYSDPSSVNKANSFIEVKDEQFKVGLVGRDGKNIEHLESKYDVEVIFNDYPKTITVGGFNLVKRQIVKYAIDSLQKSRKLITPKTIDAALERADTKVHKIMNDKAKEACRKIGLKNVPEGVLKHIGRLHFRTSYGQNVLNHCLEVGIFSGLLAGEVGANVEIARVAGFFHDIGKAISEESDKGHDYITKDILEEYNYPEEIIHAAWVHHEAEPTESLEAKIVMAADALSASRPGARLESLERYLERIRALESTANSFPGIKKTFAISAGREVRVLVRPDQVTDETMNELAHNIAQKIEDELNYPGNVKVNVIRRQKWKTTANKRSKKEGTSRA